jgi:hypothetical protein
MQLIYVQDGDDKMYLKDGAVPEHQVWTLDRDQAQRVEDDAAEAVAAWLHIPLAVHSEDADASPALVASEAVQVRAAGVQPTVILAPGRFARMTDDHPSDNGVAQAVERTVASSQDGL